MNLRDIQTLILKLVAHHFPQVHLVGGTALAMHFNHRESEDLDFFCKPYSTTLHKQITKRIKNKLGYKSKLIEEVTKKDLIRMHRYELDIKSTKLLKMDIVEEIFPLIHPRTQEGLASVDDIYYRKIKIAVGDTQRKSITGSLLPSKRQEAKDAFDLWFLSEKHAPLSDWFPKYFDGQDYQRLEIWFRQMKGMEKTLELLNVAAPSVDARRIWSHLEQQLEKLNRHFVGD